MLCEDAPKSPWPSLGPATFLSLNSERHTFFSFLCMFPPDEDQALSVLLLVLWNSWLFPYNSSPCYVATCLLCGGLNFSSNCIFFFSSSSPSSSSGQLPRIIACYPWEDFFQNFLVRKLPSWFRKSQKNEEWFLAALLPIFRLIHSFYLLFHNGSWTLEGTNVFFRADYNPSLIFSNDHSHKFLHSSLDRKASLSKAEKSVGNGYKHKYLEGSLMLCQFNETIVFSLLSLQSPSLWVFDQVYDTQVWLPFFGVVLNPIRDYLVTLVTAVSLLHKSAYFDWQAGPLSSTG